MNLRSFEDVPNIFTPITCHDGTRFSTRYALLTLHHCGH